MPRLFVNVDHVATLREARQGLQPDPFEIAALAQAAGADGITMHLREDRRHVQDADLQRYAEEGKLPLNFELAAHAEIMDLCLALRPAIATLVPERREEVTTEGGLDLVGQADRLGDAARRLSAAGIQVSFFIDPDVENVRLSRELGADTVELHTGPYANARSAEEREARRLELSIAAAQTVESGLILNAGHGLDARNVGPVARLPEMADLNIGHALIARSIAIGIQGAVQEILAAMRGS